VTGSTAGLHTAWAVRPAGDEPLQQLGELSVYQSSVNCLGCSLTESRALGGDGAELTREWSSAQQGRPAWRLAA
jgi:hypothetical protein